MATPPQIAIPVGRSNLTGSEAKYVSQVLLNNRLSMGPFVEKFETDFAKYIGVQYAFAVSSGTAALHLALRAGGLRAGSEVLVPALTFVATANAVRYCGATPVVVDVDPYTWCMDADKIEAAITSKTSAILPVHLYGVPARMKEINAIARHHHLWVIEDAAEALGAETNGRKVGGLGLAGCFSFYGNKTITTGEGGMVVTDNESTADRLKLLRGQGQAEGRPYWHTEVGFNYRMTELQAAVGCAQMEQLDEFLSARRLIVSIYRQMMPDLHMQYHEHGDWSGNWAVAALVPHRKDRDDVIARLAEAGIETRPVFYPLNALPMYEVKGCSVAADIARRGIVLPTYPGLIGSDIHFITHKFYEAIDG